jgi:hypothetical protein
MIPYNWPDQVARILHVPTTVLKPGTRVVLLRDIGKQGSNSEGSLLLWTIRQMAMTTDIRFIGFF